MNHFETLHSDSTYAATTRRAKIVEMHKDAAFARGGALHADSTRNQVEAHQVSVIGA